jgi:hypothetical protein
MHNSFKIIKILLYSLFRSTCFGHSCAHHQEPPNSAHTASSHRVSSGEWKKLHNEEMNDLYSLPNIVRVVKSRRMRWAGHVARMREDRGVHRMLVGKSKGKRPLGRPRRRWEDNIKMDLQEVGGGRGDWLELAQDRDRWRALVGTVRNFRVP